MKIIKLLVIIVTIISLVFLIGTQMAFREFMYIGEGIERIYDKNEIRVIEGQGSLYLIEDDTSYCYLNFDNHGRVCSSVRFSSEGEIIANKGHEVLKITKEKALEIIKEKSNKANNILEIIDLYGQPHGDLGSGFYIPYYILSDTSILALYTTDETVFYDARILNWV